jgi:hypothetical protein
LTGNDDHLFGQKSLSNGFAWWFFGGSARSLEMSRHHLPPQPSLNNFVSFTKEPLRKTSFANRQPGPYFQVSATSSFTHYFCKAL